MSIATKFSSSSRGRHKRVRGEMNPDLKREADTVCASIRSWCNNGGLPATLTYRIRCIRTPDDYYGLRAAIDRAMHGYDCEARLPEVGETRLEVEFA